MVPTHNNLTAPYPELQARTSAEAMTMLETRPSGLTPQEVAERLLRDGPNELPKHEKRWASTLARQFTSPLVGLLAGAATISFILRQATDGVTIIVILMLNGFLSFTQEYRSAHALTALRRFLKASTTVRRNNSITEIIRRELVQGDVILFKAGDIVPADVRITHALNLTVDESTLTGESIEVTKIAGALDKPSSQVITAINMVFSGSTVRRGEGEGIVVATGSRSIVGTIAHLVETAQPLSTFEHNVKVFSRFLIRVVAISLAIVFTANLLTKGETIHVSEQLLFALALAISVVPEALPAVTAITLSRGALQLARRHVVVKRLSAIEDLGHIEILCTDKTGTLTENHLAVAKLLGSNRRQLIHFLLAAIPPTVRTGGRESGDPFDSSLLGYATQEAFPVPSGDILMEIPFDPERRRSGVVVREQAHHWLVVRGAPEAVVPLCANLKHDGSLERITNDAEKLGQAGERVIAVAVRELETPYPKQVQELEKNLSFVGLVSFADPIKSSTRRALIDAERLGVEIKIVTGDSAAVAGAVALKLGIIRTHSGVITGEQLDRMNGREYTQAARHYRVFARMTPIDKYKLIATLRQFASVGFLGEGINDAPALKLASVSLVVNSASDVAREAADIVLLDKSIHVIVEGIQQGRVIFTNTLKYLKYTLVGNFGNFFAIAGISLLINYLPMLPIQILLTNLLTDFPLVAVAGDSVDPNEVRRPPHFRLRELGFLTLTLGVVSSLFDFIFFGIFRLQPSNVVQTMWFVESILTELLLIYSIRTVLPIHKAKAAAPALIWLTVIAGIITVMLPFTVFGQSVFHFTKPLLLNVTLVLGLVLAYGICTEAVKQMYYRQYRYRSGDMVSPTNVRAT